MTTAKAVDILELLLKKRTWPSLTFPRTSQIPLLCLGSSLGATEADPIDSHFRGRVGGIFGWTGMDTRLKSEALPSPVWMAVEAS